MSCATGPAISMPRKVWLDADPLCLDPRGRGYLAPQPLGQSTSFTAATSARQGRPHSCSAESCRRGSTAGRRSGQMRDEDLAGPVHPAARRAQDVSAVAATPVSRHGVASYHHRGRGGDRRKAASHLSGVDLQLAPLRGRPYGISPTIEALTTVREENAVRRSSCALQQITDPSPPESGSTMCRCSTGENYPG